MKIEILIIFFVPFVNMGPNGSENFKKLLPLQIEICPAFGVLPLSVANIPGCT